MSRITPQEAAAKWASRLSGSTTEIQRGVDAVTESPTAKAAAKKDKMLNNLTRAVQSGKWEAGLNRVSLAQWKEAIKSKGIPRIANGATQAQPKMAQFMSQLLPFQDSLKSEIDSMPDLSLDDSINRASAWIRGMANFKRS